MKRSIALVIVLGIARTAAAQNADDYRGGWRTDSGDPHIYQFSIRGERVRGVYCTYCADATTLAFIEGTFGPKGITFVVTHADADGRTTSQDRATATFDNGNLLVTGTSGTPGGGAFRRIVIKDPRGPDPLPVPVSRLPPGDGPVPAMTFGRGGAPGGGRGGYVPPHPGSSCTSEVVSASSRPVGGITIRAESVTMPPRCWSGRPCDVAGCRASISAPAGTILPGRNIMRGSEAPWSTSQ